MRRDYPDEESGGEGDASDDGDEDAAAAFGRGRMRKALGDDWCGARADHHTCRHSLRSRSSVPKGQHDVH